MEEDVGDLDEQMNEGSRMNYSKISSLAMAWFPTLVSVIFATVAFVLFQRRRPKHKEMNGIIGRGRVDATVLEGTRCTGKSEGGCCKEDVGRSLKILYGTNTGTAAEFAKKLGRMVRTIMLPSNDLE